MFAVEQIYDMFVKVPDNDIITMLDNSLNTSYHSQLNNRIIYLVVFTICLNILFAVLCYPLLTAVHNYVVLSREMLAIVPVDCLIICKSFEKLIVKQLKK